MPQPRQDSEHYYASPTDSPIDVICCSISWRELESAKHGSAVDETYISDGKLWADNGEYCVRINYCPFCGKSAEEIIAESV